MSPGDGIAISVALGGFYLVKAYHSWYWRTGRAYAHKLRKRR